MFVGFVLAMLVSPSSARAATCTFEQKQASAASLAAFQRTAAAAKRAYFKRHTSAKQRAAFVKAQQRKLSALRSAAGCSVPPLPPSSNESCSFMLAPNAENARRGVSIAGPLFNEGPIAASAVLPSRGHVNAVMLFVDFPDLPGTESPAAIGAVHTTALKFFDEVSYGRLTLSVTMVERWFRVPETAPSYNPLSFHQHRFMGQAIAAADPTVDFSPYQFVFFVGPQGVILGNRGYAIGAGYGYRADGNELRFASILDPGIRKFGNGASDVLNHEFSHTLGLPDLGGFVSGWDPMGASSGGDRVSNAHFLGWHKWKLGWLDPPQLTCLNAPGRIEETLTPIAVAGGKKLVVVPITDSLAYVVEVRRHIGYDRGACEEGVLVYTVNSQLLNSQGAIIVKGPAACGVASPGALSTGEAHDDEFVKVEVLASDGSAYRVRVTKK